MRTLKFFNPQNTVVVDVETDAISATNDNFTVHDVNFIAGTANDIISAGFDVRQLPTTRVAMKALATSMNLSLAEINSAENASTSLNSATALSISTTALDACTTGVAESTVVTAVAFASTAQGDFFKIWNKAGISYAVWLDKDGAGTTPSGTIFTAATYKIKVGIVTGDTNIQVAGKIKAAIIANASWTGFNTIVDGGNGTLTFTCSALGTCTDAVRKNAAESGNGSFTVSVSAQGVGDYSYTLASAGGNAPFTYSISSGTLPAGITLSSAGVISGVTSVSGSHAVTYKTTDRFGQTATKALTLTVS